ncbi:TPA: hypothetical protein F6U22_23285 [Escherichia coli]|nr:hypothetical protein [Escherichia coli]
MDLAAAPHLAVVVETVGLLRNLTRWRTALMRMDMVLAEVVAGENTVMRQWAVVMHHLAAAAAMGLRVL